MSELSKVSRTALAVEGARAGLLEDMRLRWLLLTRYAPQAMYYGQSANRMEHFGRFWMHGLRESCRISNLHMARAVGSRALSSIKSSYPRFKTGKQGLDDELAILDAAERISLLHPDRSWSRFHVDNPVFGMCGMLDMPTGPWRELHGEAEAALAVVAYPERRRIITLLWHASRLRARSSLAPLGPEVLRLLEEASSFCREAREDAGSPRHDPRVQESLDGMRAVIRQDVE